jgi:3-methyl-2-oxobutanoate hydroxymethyltransferase
MAKRITTRKLLQMKQAGERIAMITAYDYPTARILDEAGVHVLLVGDSLGMVVQGHDSTIPVTLDDVVYHTRMVSRAAQRALVVADLPFLTYQVSPEQALQNASRLMQDGGAHAVKLEGGGMLAGTVRRLVDAGIPVMGHIGLTPQSVHALGGFTVQGKSREAAQRLLEDALALEAAGAFSLVLEMVPAEVAGWIRDKLAIPVIGIGAGPECDGQVLVFHDMMGLTSGYIPRHNKVYANLAQIIRDAATAYLSEVVRGEFPGEAQTVRLKPEEAEAFADLLNAGHPAPDEAGVTS